LTTSRHYFCFQFICTNGSKSKCPHLQSFRFYLYSCLLFHYDLTTSGLLKKVSVIYGHRVLREEQEEEDDV